LKIKDKADEQLRKDIQKFNSKVRVNQQPTKFGPKRSGIENI